MNRYFTKIAINNYNLVVSLVGFFGIKLVFPEGYRKK